MATITQTISSDVVFRNWKRPPDPYLGPMPFSELKATSIDEIAILAGGNVGIYSFSTILPRNYAYRLVELRMQFASSSEGDLDNLQTGMEWVVTENQVTTKRFMTYNAVAFRNLSATLSSIQTRNPAVTNDFTTEQAFMNPAGIFTDLIDASEGQSVMLGVIVDSVGTTAAIGTVFYARFLAYTVEQLNSGNVWQSTPVLS